MNKQFIHFYKYFLALAMVAILVSCEEEDNATPDDPQVKLSAKVAPGHNQYRERVESGDEINIDVEVTSSAGLSKFTVTKTVNLSVDSTFGENGVLTVNPGGGSSFEYPFQYVPVVEDIDELVGFTFRAENANGSASESDLTLQVTLSPRDNLTMRRWLLKSVLHVNNEEEPNKEEIKECEKDNSMLLNADSTMVMDYGSDTGQGDCMFDGFNVYTSWHLTEDEKYFIRESHGIFSPDVTVIDSFRVKTLTVDQLAMEQDVDLTVFGMGIETFLYVYDATPR